MQIIGAPSLFGWYFVFVVINLTQLLYILYQLRPVTFDRDLDGIYTKMFEPFSISRLEFKRLISAESAQVRRHNDPTNNGTTRATPTATPLVVVGSKFGLL